MVARQGSDSDADDVEERRGDTPRKPILANFMHFMPVDNYFIKYIINSRPILIPQLLDWRYNMIPISLCCCVVHPIPWSDYCCELNCNAKPSSVSQLYGTWYYIVVPT